MGPVCPVSSLRTTLWSSAPLHEKPGEFHVRKPRQSGPISQHRAMPSPHSRPLLTLTLALTLLALVALLLTALAIERATPEELATVFPSAASAAR